MKTFAIHYVSRKAFPDLPLVVPWNFIEPAREQAMANHDQTLERLNERGGLDATEMIAALDGKPLNFSGDKRLHEIAARDLLRRIADWSESREGKR